MSGAAFTPGPWSVSTVPYGSGKRHNILGRTGKFAVAHTYGDPRPAAENLANARLIAAAPDLFEALTRINDTGDAALDIDWIRRISRAALAKARGEQQ